MNDEYSTQKERAFTLIDKAGFPLSAADRDNLVVLDFGLDNLEREGVQYIDLFLSPNQRITLLVLLPNQTLPQHMHPAYDTCPGKEEAGKGLFGEFRVYTPGPNTMERGFIIEGKQEHYTSRFEQIIYRGDTFCSQPAEYHWFQAGAQGAVVLEFQNRVDESKNVFTDPAVTGVCGIASAMKGLPFTANLT